MTDTTHYGNLLITKDNQEKMKHLTEVTGTLEIQKDTHFSALNLKDADNIKLQSGSSLEVPRLKQLGYLSMDKDSKIFTSDFTRAHEITVDKNALIHAPSLKDVHAKLHIKEGANVNLPELNYAKSIEIDRNSNLDASNLKTIGNDLKMDHYTSITAPKLDSVKSADQGYDAKMNTPSLNIETRVIDLKPTEINPLTRRERDEVRESLDEGKFKDERYAQNMFKKFDKNLESIPDTVQGLKLENIDKIKLLTGESISNQKGNTYVEMLSSDKQMSYSKGNERGIVNESNSQFSDRQIQKQSETKENKASLAM